MAFLYLDPATAGHEACRRRMADPVGPVSCRHVDEPAVVAATAQGGDALRRVATAGADGASARIDARIRDSLRAITDTGGADIPTELLARRAGLSPTRFRRLFVQQAGIGIRPYRRWARMITVARVVAAGGDLTRAAADAGFATPSHLTHAFGQMFGLRPSHLLAAGGRIRVSAPETAARP